MVSPSTMPQHSESIKLEQLAEHNTLDSLWIAVHGHGKLHLEIDKVPVTKTDQFSVYDLTTFCSDHPGGVEALESHGGIDGTEAYKYAGHSIENTATMQQYRVGRLAGNPEESQQISRTSHIVTYATERRRESSVFHAWKKLAVTVSATSLATALSYQRWDDLVGLVSPMLNSYHLQFRLISDRGVELAFWAGILLASSVSCLGFSYLYKLFTSTLDHQNEVWSFPPTIPRKIRR